MTLACLCLLVTIVTDLAIFVIFMLNVDPVGDIWVVLSAILSCNPPLLGCPPSFVVSFKMIGNSANNVLKSSSTEISWITTHSWRIVHKKSMPSQAIMHRTINFCKHLLTVHENCTLSSPVKYVATYVIRFYKIYHISQWTWDIMKIFRNNELTSGTT